MRIMRRRVQAGMCARGLCEEKIRQKCRRKAFLRGCCGKNLGAKEVREVRTACSDRKSKGRRWLARAANKAGQRARVELQTSLKLWVKSRKRRQERSSDMCRGRWRLLECAQSAKTAPIFRNTIIDRERDDAHGKARNNGKYSRLRRRARIDIRISR